MNSNKQNKRGPVNFDYEEEPIIELIEEIDKYNEIRSAFKTSEYISAEYIPIIMTHHFNSSELILPINESHAVYKIMIKDLLIDSVTNWEYNRPPDMERIPDIAKYIYKSKCPFETMIYLSFNKQNEKFDILDGIHRITALKKIKKENSKPLDFLSSSKFGSGNDANWLFNQYVFVNIRFNSSKGDLIDMFENLNKSQAVPELYMGNQSKNKIEIIKIIYNEWYVQYKLHFSGDKVINPNTGNTNCNNFTNLLDKLYDKHKCKDENKLRHILDNANKKLSENKFSKVSDKVLNKCKETGCYLFLLKNDKLLEII